MKTELEQEDLTRIANAAADLVVERLKGHISINKKEDGFLTVDELADYLKVKKSWIYQKVHSKDIKYHKIGNKLRFKKSEIDFDC
jgi:excisionase family DNA binding protein